MKITIHFDDSEFDCHDGTPVPGELFENCRTLAGLLETIRWSTGPVAVVSGYRTKEWNDKVGGAANSTHLTAEGADIRVARMTSAELHDAILGMHRAGKLPTLGGLGLYRAWVHVDTRRAADGHLRRWKGSGVGSEQ